MHRAAWCPVQQPNRLGNAEAGLEALEAALAAP
jgi:hypothetical protein